jgi:hypothetical protein
MRFNQQPTSRLLSFAVTLFVLPRVPFFSSLANSRGIVPSSIVFKLFFSLTVFHFSFAVFPFRQSKK